MFKEFKEKQKIKKTKKEIAKKQKVLDKKEKEVSKLKEDIIKMGKFVLREGKVIEEKDTKSQELQQPPMPELKQPPVPQMEVQSQNDIPQSANAYDEQVVNRVVQGQREIKEEEYQRQLEMERQRQMEIERQRQLEMERQRQMSQQPVMQHPPLNTTMPEPVMVNMILYLNNTNPVTVQVNQNDIDGFREAIANAINNGTAISIGHLLINGQNIVYLGIE